MAATRLLDLSVEQPQNVLAQLIGVSEARLSQLASEIPTNVPAGDWLLAYCHRLREQAAGRMGADNFGLDLVQERAALARAQREGIEIKNAALRGEYASVELLAQVLANASQAVAERFDHLKAEVRQACPDLPPEATERVLVVIASARNAWVGETAELVARALQTAEEAEESDEPLPD